MAWDAEMARVVDAIIIGGGPAGYTSAIRMAQLGKKPLLVEKSDLGGTCTNKGCIPTKALLHAAKVFRDARQGSRMGIRGEGVALDFTQLQQWNRFVVEKVRRGVKYLLDSNGVEVVKGEATFLSSKRLLLRPSGEELSSNRILIATGSRPSDLPCARFDSRGILSSDEIPQMQSLPSKLAIIGGGVVGVEMATAFAYMGSKVTMVELMGQILPGFDAELVRPVHDSLAKAGVELNLGCSVAESGYTGDGKVRLLLADGRTILADRALVAVGRRPDTQSLGLQKAGVDVDGKGFIRVNDFLGSTSDGIYAAGDATGLPYLAHRAMDQGLLAAWNMLKGEGQSRYCPHFPSVVYSDPELAIAGMDQQACASRGLDVVVGSYSFGASGRAQTMGRSEGFVKVIAERNSQKLIGVGMVGQSASELIGGCSALMRASATLTDVSSGGFPHPTLSEAIMEAARSALKKA
jgi:dihydrolipoamide dehydrogenase